MKSRRSLALAIAASLCLHGAACWTLSRLDSRGKASSVAAVKQSPIELLPAFIEPGAKLDAGDRQPSGKGQAGLPATAVQTIEIAITPGDSLGPPIASGLPAGASGNNGAGSGSAPGGASTTFFGVPARGQKVVYLLDRSCSMGLHGALAAAQRELMASLEQLPSAAQFQVILYNSTPRALLGSADELLPATPDNLRRAAAALTAFDPEGGTNHMQAFIQALYLRPDVLYFLTDADDLTVQAEQDILRRNNSRTVIHTIELSLAHRGQPEMPMQHLARATGGTYRALDVVAGQ